MTTCFSGQDGVDLKYNNIVMNIAININNPVTLSEFHDLIICFIP